MVLSMAWPSFGQVALDAKPVAALGFLGFPLPMAHGVPRVPSRLSRLNGACGGPRAPVTDRLSRLSKISKQDVSRVPKTRRLSRLSVAFEDQGFPKQVGLAG